MYILRIILMSIIMLAVYGGVNYYVAKRLYRWFKYIFPRMKTAVFLCIYIFLAVIMIPWVPAGYVLAWVAAYWMGIFLYLLAFLIIADVALLLGKAVKLIPKPVPEKVRFTAGLCVMVLTAGVVVYGFVNAGRITTTSYELELRESAALDGMRIALVSDLHLGGVGNERNVAEMVRLINEAEPDIVCMAGDIFNDDFNAVRNPERVMELFKSINATYGVFAVLGNHDAGETVHQMKEFLEASHIQLLNDEYVIIDNRLALLGRLDAYPMGYFGGLRRKDISEITLPERLPVIVIEHNPIHIDEYGNAVDVILAGHTHRGQLFPGNLLTGLIYAVHYGHYQRDAHSPHVIVTSGVGTWGLPMRVGSRNEVAHITLR